ncbi:MAG: peptidylprolyl isomerase [Bacteroidales bacterium]|nr:peptidylprolyl isomerase [Bacteroidales bacterium]
MKSKSTKNFFYTLFLIIGISFGAEITAQTVVQWYTNMGDFRAQLREDLVPVTAQNFIDLSNEEFYDDLVFHRVISGFMIQDGCPDGTGYGGPGYSFDDEFHPDLRHDEPGILSMANSGPNTNGSQYFITVAPTAWLDDAHAVFGKIIDGMDVVYAISEVATNASNRPLVDVEIDSIRVVSGIPEIELLTPVDDGVWNASSDNNITWESAFIADVRIEFSSDNGDSWVDIIDESSANTRSFEWEAPELVSDQCLIRISDVANPTTYSINEIPFTLCNLNLVSPNGFETFRMGTPVEVNWQSEFVGDLSLSYQTEEDGEWIVFAEDVSSDEQMIYWTPEESTIWCKIKVSDMLYPDVYDISDFKFFVIQLDLNAPIGDEDLAGESVFDIEWESEIVNNVKIEFTADAGQNWETLVSSMPASDNTYAWTVPNIDAEACTIKISHASHAELYSENQIFFSISKVQGLSDESLNEIMLLSPNPADDLITVSFNNNRQFIESIEVYTLNGELVLTQRLAYYVKEDLQINISSLADGAYLMKIISENKTHSQQFIKVKR